MNHLVYPPHELDWTVAIVATVVSTLLGALIGWAMDRSWNRDLPSEKAAYGCTVMSAAVFFVGPVVAFLITAHSDPDLSTAEKASLIVSQFEVDSARPVDGHWAVPVDGHWAVSVGGRESTCDILGTGDQRTLQCTPVQPAHREATR